MRNKYPKPIKGTMRYTTNLSSPDPFKEITFPNITIEESLKSFPKTKKWK